MNRNLQVEQKESSTKIAEMNEALMISAMRQHELTTKAEELNEQLQNEIAERKRAQESTFLLASIVEGSDDSIISLDFNQIITSWNKGAERLYGYSADEVIGKSFSMLTLPEDLKIALDRVHQIESGEKVRSFEIERRQKDGTHMWVSVTLSPIRNEKGEIVGVSTVSREITDQKRLENELRAAKAQLESHAYHLEEIVNERTAKLRQSVKYLEDLNYTIAHDLRAPVRAMLAFANALVEDVPLNEIGKQYAGRIERAAHRMNQLVNDLLEYSELTHLQFPIHPVSLQGELDIVLSKLGSAIEEAGAEIEVQQPLPTVLGNETLVGQVLTNLLLNAIKFVPAGKRPKVFIYGMLSDKVARLWVEDNGIGIDPEYHERVFGVFQRLHTTEEFPGTGVGLAIIRRATERMNGQVGVESEAGKGSKFWIELPIPS